MQDAAGLCRTRSSCRLNVAIGIQLTLNIRDDSSLDCKPVNLAAVNITLKSKKVSKNDKTYCLINPTAYSNMS